MGKIVIEKVIIEKHFTMYERFAKKAFGDDSYQASKSYLVWLERNTDKSFVAIETSRNEVVGFISAINTKWTIDGEVKLLIVPHNFMVLPEFRCGVGVGIFFKTFKKDGCLFAPGVTGEMNDFYKKLGAVLTRTSQYRKVLRPVSGGLKLLMAKFFNINFAPCFFESCKGKKINCSSDVKVEFNPSHMLISKLEQLWNNYSTGFIAPYFDEEYFKWRFFHSDGPKHLLIYLGSETEVSDFIVLSLGPKKGVNIARILLTVANSELVLQKLLSCAEMVLKRCKTDVLLSIHSDIQLDSLYKVIGLKQIESYVNMYLYLSGKEVNPDLFKFHSFAGDYGFEAIK